MKKNGLIASAGVGALAAFAVGVGGYWAQASAAPGGAVNAAPAAAAPASAPGSFADVIARVAPAVVSIDVEGKGGPSRVALQGRDAGPGQQFGFGGGDDQDDQDDNGGGGLPFDFRNLIPQQRGDGGQQRAQPKMQATGSGFFISADGYIVTNNHVVEGADKITVRTNDDRSLPAHLVGRDEATDLAVIKVDGGRFPFVSFEDRAKPRVGDWVIAMGNPFDLGGTATAGIVSALGRADVSGSSYVDYLQIDAPINHGNSGGPSFDVYGRVVGVNSAIFSPSGGSVGIGFDIPADVAASISKQLISSGKVTRGYIGATVQSVTPEIADSLGLADHKGALIADLTPGGPSERAGLKPGDLVVKINGHDVASASDLTRQVGLARAGEDIHMAVRRDGQTVEIVIRSGTRPTEASLAQNGRRGGGDDQGGSAQQEAARVLGMRLTPNDGGGVTVANVSNNSDAAEKGLARGDVIERVGSHRVSSPADVSAAVAEAKRAGRPSVLLEVSHNGQHGFVPVKVDGADRG